MEYQTDLFNSLVIAPHLSGEYFCDEAFVADDIHSEEDAAIFCASIGKNAANRISAMLDSIGPKISPSGKYQLGYILTLPLMRYYRKGDDDHWFINKDILEANLQTIADVDRPVVLYLSTNHFTDANQELSLELARDPRNLMWNRHGPIHPDDYFNHPIIPWTLSDQAAPINLLRRQVFRAATDLIAGLPSTIQDRIIALSILGEVHDMYPRFTDSPGYGVELYNASDYSPLSVQGFRAWLKDKYLTIDCLNRHLAADFSSFEIINPPSKDIRKEILDHFFEHIDLYAAGRIPIYGWVHDEQGRTLNVCVYLNGVIVGAATMGLSRTDVTDAVSKIKNPNIGFRLNLDYRTIELGIHTLEILVSAGNQEPLQLAKTSLVMVDRNQSASSQIAYLDTKAKPMSSDCDLSGALDGPAHLQSVFFNPLARLWLEYRNQVVRNYIEQFAKIAMESGIPKSKLFSHQIAPHLYGDWNADLVSTDGTQQPSMSYNQGVTLYGGTAFGDAFASMKRQFAWERYSVNEMHPIVTLTNDEYFSMFDMHRTNGAVFVAPYFMSIIPNVLPYRNDLERFTIAPDNQHCGSNYFWQSIIDIMKQ